jgi:hypothetical protein
MNDTTQMKAPEPGSGNRKSLLIGVAVAAVAAVAVLVIFVLPAEFGVDPTGAGEATGLTGLAAAGEMTEAERGALREGAFTLSDEPMRVDRRTFEIRPYAAIEFKYTLQEGDPLVFSWTSTGPVTIDMHAHPFDGGVALTETYSQGEGKTGETGLYVAPFTGIHGWYWQNRTLDNVTVTINAAGPFTETTIFDDLGETPEAIAPVE